MSSAYASWFEEKQSATIYRLLATVETNSRVAKLFEKLGAAAEEQSLQWEQKAGESSKQWSFQPTLRARLVMSLAKKLGPKRVRGILAAMKVRGLSVYDAPMLPAGGHDRPTRVEDVGGRHKSSGSAGNLRAAVFGVNDGLLSNASLIIGIAGARGDPYDILLVGVAGGLAGALSMAAGEYVSVRAQREMVESQIALEREELAEYPDEEAQELALIYEARGLPAEEASVLAKKLIADPEVGLAVLAREELGIDPTELSSPWAAGVFSFLSFAVGSTVPLIPFVLAAFWRVSHALPLCLGLTGCALFSVGSAISLFTGRNALWGGVRLVVIGGGAGFISYFIGTLLSGGLL